MLGGQGVQRGYHLSESIVKVLIHDHQVDVLLVGALQGRGFLQRGLQIVLLLAVEKLDLILFRGETRLRVRFMAMRGFITRAASV